MTAINGDNSYYVSQDSSPVQGSCAEASLVAQWKFNGDATDATGNGHTGTVSGATLTTGQDGQVNGAYLFNGTSNISFGNSTDYNSPEITFSAWIKTTASSVQTIIAKEGQYKYRIVSATLYGYLVSLQATGWDTLNTVGSTITSGVWYHVVLTISSKDNLIKLYVDGSSLSSDALGGTITAYNTNPLFVGSYNTSNSEPFYGSIDDARIYNRALTADEIQSIYVAGAQ